MAQTPTGEADTSQWSLEQWAQDVRAARLFGGCDDDEPDALLMDDLAAVVLKHGLPDKSGIPYHAYAVFMRRCLRAMEGAHRIASTDLTQETD